MPLGHPRRPQASHRLRHRRGGRRAGRVRLRRRHRRSREALRVGGGAGLLRPPEHRRGGQRRPAGDRQEHHTGGGARRLGAHRHRPSVAARREEGRGGGRGDAGEGGRQAEPTRPEVLRVEQIRPGAGMGRAHRRRRRRRGGEALAGALREGHGFRVGRQPHRPARPRGRVSPGPEDLHRRVGLHAQGAEGSAAHGRADERDGPRRRHRGRRRRHQAQRHGVVHRRRLHRGLGPLRPARARRRGGHVRPATRRAPRGDTRRVRRRRKRAHRVRYQRRSAVRVGQQPKGGVGHSHRRRDESVRRHRVRARGHGRDTAARGPGQARVERGGGEPGGGGVVRELSHRGAREVGDGRGGAVRVRVEQHGPARARGR
mmetsp:Transcript_12293/g.55498  ORF Transcript_12293/g.55498 Transcript_12293/m.55498 type:complete len:372 (+) Transcript_12293:112-1227(+)